MVNALFKRHKLKEEQQNQVQQLHKAQQTCAEKQTAQPTLFEEKKKENY
jgi:hypothetical protein